MSASARVSPQLIERIRKLLALARSANRFEAENARSKANGLMRANGLTRADIYDGPSIAAGRKGVQKLDPETLRRQLITSFSTCSDASLKNSVGTIFLRAFYDLEDKPEVPVSVMRDTFRLAMMSGQIEHGSDDDLERVARLTPAGLRSRSSYVEWSRQHGDWARRSTA